MMIKTTSVCQRLVSVLTGLGLSAALCFASAAQAAKNPVVQLQTSMGNISMELYPDAAPKTVANFLQNVKEKQYDGTIFHRVIENFMVQAGGMDVKMNEKTTRAPIELEALASVGKGLHNRLGMVAMARTMDPNSAAAQFFINTQDNPVLDANPQNPGYAVFAKVIKGMDVVEKIKKVATTNAGQHQNVPVKPIVITKAVLVK